MSRARISASRPPRAPACEVRSSPPPPRTGEVPRADLVRRLDAAAAASRLVLVSAPAGYGKTTLLAQWARAADAPVAWLTLRPAHQVARRLVADVADAIRGASGGEVVGAPGPASAVRADPDEARRPVLLVLDDADAVSSPDAVAALSALVADPPGGVVVALACRSDRDLLLGRRRVEEGLLRITAGDLALSLAESHALMSAAGVELTPEALSHVHACAEGWAAGVRLAALRAREGSDPSAAAAAFTGDDRFVADYMSEAMLDALAPEARDLVTRSSVLEPLTGALCDSVLGTTGSAERLRELERSNLLLVPLDARGERYRYHRLLGEMLRGELYRSDPDAVDALHRRAGAWHEERGEEEGAVHHAMAAGDRAHAAQLLWRALPAGLTRGRIGTLERMLARFDVDDVAASAPLSLASAWCAAETRGDLSAHHLAMAERAPAPADPTTRAEVVAGIGALRAMLARDGLSQMRRDASDGFRTAPDDGPWRAYCRLAEGAARHLQGDMQAARLLLEDGVERAGRIAPSVPALCLARLAVLLLDEDEPVRALIMARRSCAVVEEWGLRPQVSAALPYGVCALALAVSGHADEARDHLRDARGILAATVDASAWFAVEVRVVVARAGIALGDEDAAREALWQAEPFLERLRDIPPLRDEIEQLRRRVRPVPDADAETLSSITAAETRVLRLLPTHHSFREIGDLLFLSRFTVKSHAHSLYRKLGVSSRSRAVERARALRLLTGSPIDPPAG